MIVDKSKPDQKYEVDKCFKFMDSLQTIRMPLVKTQKGKMPSQFI